MKLTRLEFMYLLSILENKVNEGDRAISHYESLRLPTGKKDMMFKCMVEDQIVLTSAVLKLKAMYDES